MANSQTDSDRHITEKLTFERILEIKDFDTRDAGEEIDSLEICPEHPDFMVFGTYALRKKDEGKEFETQIRRGSLQVMLVNRVFKPKYLGQLTPQLDRKEFNCAIWDLHFHPIEQSILGVATSNADMHFYRFVKSGDVVDRRITTTLLHLGSISFDDSGSDDVTPSITRFTWLPEMEKSGGLLHVDLAISLTTGLVKLFRTAIPIENVSSNRPLQHQSVDTHMHGFQAWSVALAPLPSVSNTLQHVLLSGGDDCVLFASVVNFNRQSVSKSPLANEIYASWRDRRTHSGGVVSVLVTESMLVPDKIDNETSLVTKSIIPVFTGSYDDHIRLYELDVTRSSSVDGSRLPAMKLVSELNLRGGIWRLKVMDLYEIVDESVASSTATNKARGAVSQIGSEKIESLPYERHLLILVSAMYAGVKIVRAKYTSDISEERIDQHGRWTLSLEAEFSAGHTSIVYAADSVPDWKNSSVDLNLSENGKTKSTTSISEENILGQHTVVSTSYYDMKICVWKYVDEKRKSLLVKRKSLE